MSHLTRIKTQLVEQEYLLRALQDLGYTYEVGDLRVGALGERTPVEIKVRTGFLSAAIGFRKAGTAYEMVADWSLVWRVTRDTFLRQLTQRYAYHAAKAKLQEQGFTLAAEEKQPDGQIRLVLRRMG
jgi:hypothetical protein